MSRILQKLNLVPVGASDAESGMLSFPVHAVEALCADFATAIPIQEVAEYLGASQRQVQALCAAGILRPLVPADGPGSVRKVVFGRAHLDEFLGKLRGDIADVSDSRKEFLTIAEACQRCGGTTADLVEAIFAGRLTAWRRPGGSGLASVMVRASACKALLAEIPPN